MITILGIFLYGLYFLALLLIWFLLRFIFKLFIKDTKKLNLIRNVFISVLFLLPFGIDGVEKSVSYFKNIQLKNEEIASLKRYLTDQNQEWKKIIADELYEEMKNAKYEGIGMADKPPLYYLNNEFKIFSHKDITSKKEKLKKLVNDRAKQIEVTKSNLWSFKKSKELKRTGFLSTFQQERAEFFGFEDFESLNQNYKKMLFDWSNNFQPLISACEGIIPMVQNYAIFMTEEQINLTSLLNDEKLTCVSKNEGYEKFCKTVYTSKPVNLWLAKISDNSPFRVFQVEFEFGNKLSIAEEDALIENFKSKYKTKNTSKFCKNNSQFYVDDVNFSRKRYIAHIKFLSSNMVVNINSGRVIPATKENFIRITSSALTDQIKKFQSEVSRRKYLEEKNKAKNNEKLKNF